MIDQPRKPSKSSRGFVVKGRAPGQRGAKPEAKPASHQPCSVELSTSHTAASALMTVARRARLSFVEAWVRLPRSAQRRTLIEAPAPRGAKEERRAL